MCVCACAHMFAHTLSIAVGYPAGHTDCIWCVSGKPTNSDIMASTSQVC